MIRLSTPLPALATLILSATLAVPVFAQTATAPYKLSVFATAPKGSSAPDSIAVVDGHVLRLNSEVVEYRMDGTTVHTYSVPGHSDGLKVDPPTHLVWALQNEDADANLVIINPETHTQKHYTFSSAGHGGGYDDIVFRGCKVHQRFEPRQQSEHRPGHRQRHIGGTHR
jgi:hypothetical protein